MIFPTQSFLYDFILAFSSANAYMLMYRQIKMNKCSFLAEDELPDHVKELVAKLHRDEIREQELKDLQKSVCRVRIRYTSCCSLPENILSS